MRSLVNDRVLPRFTCYSRCQYLTFFFENKKILDRFCLTDPLLGRHLSYLQGLGFFFLNNKSVNICVQDFTMDVAFCFYGMCIGLELLDLCFMFDALGGFVPLCSFVSVSATCCLLLSYILFMF